MEGTMKISHLFLISAMLLIAPLVTRVGVASAL
jgi:hypothetical protein